MSKRSIRKTRHLKPSPSFKERVALGQFNKPLIVMEEAPKFLDTITEHIHGENCNH